MNHWHKYPLVRIVIPFAIGIYAGILYSYPDETIFRLILISIAIMALTAGIFHKKINYRNRRFFGVFVVLALLLFGFYWQHIHTKQANRNHFWGNYQKGSVLTGVITKQPHEREKTVKTQIRVVHQRSDSIEVSSNGLIMAYLEKDSLSKRLDYGDKVLFSGYVNAIKAPANPATFNYKRYMALRHVYQQVYIPSGSVKKLGEGYGSPLKAFSVQSRKYFSELFKKQGIEGDEFALATALVLGYDRYLDDDLRQAYSGAGAMHVLCVSGLHVGIMYVVISFLLNLIPLRSRSFTFVKVVIALVIIWLYAMITGLEPAVTRASIMFSFVAAGKLFRRKSRIYNTLAASALIILMVNPNQVAYVGFQMSYLAVTGIVWLQPKIYNWWRPSNWLLDKTWGLVSVSLAAQFILFPLLVYYFHKVSLIFIVTNIVAIPLATVIIYNALALFAFANFELLSDGFTWALTHLISWLNGSVNDLSSLPMAYMDSLWINTSQMFLFYIAIISFVFSCMYAKRKVLITTLAFLLVIFGSFVVKRHSVLEENKFIFYHTRKGLAMDFIRSGKNYFVGDSAVLADSGLINYNFRNVWEKHNLDTKKLVLNNGLEIDSAHFKMNYPFLAFNGDLFYIMDDVPAPKGYKLETDYLVISGKPWIRREFVEDRLSVQKMVLFDGTNPNWYIRKTKPYFEDAGMDCYVTSRSGAFVKTF